MPSPGLGVRVRVPADRNRPGTLRAVFDTNVVVSALVFGVRLRWLRHAWAAGPVTPVVCRETVAELLRVLAYLKFRLDKVEQELLLADYLPFAETAWLPDPPAELALGCRDRDDAVFLQLAIASRADLLVSGDADLTALAAIYPVASPSTLRSRMEQQAKLDPSPPVSGNRD
ncbi:MAG: putative toxin-antitoxin system toxin component, PIN family [Acetobacteraceae bacterium]|nr:putative toxin-antitoxin system toxin component, PIN family [Acetobacteraceae bacterium]